MDGDSFCGGLSEARMRLNLSLMPFVVAHTQAHTKWGEGYISVGPDLKERSALASMMADFVKSERALIDKPAGDEDTFYLSIVGTEYLFKVVRGKHDVVNKLVSPGIDHVYFSSNFPPKEMMDIARILGYQWEASA